MFSSWFDLNLQIVSETEVFAFIAIIIRLAIVHELDSLFGKSQLMKRRGKIFDCRVFLFSMLNGFEVKLKCFDKISLLGFCFFCFLVKSFFLTILRISFVAVVSVVFLQSMLKRLDQGNDCGRLVLI